MVVVVVVGILMLMVMVMVMMVMIRVKAGGGRIVELDCEGGDLIGWLMREEDDGGGWYLSFGVSCTTGRTYGRIGWDGIWYSTSVVTSVIDLEDTYD